MTNLLTALRIHFATRGLEKRCRKLARELDACDQHLRNAKDKTDTAGIEGQGVRYYINKNDLAGASLKWSNRSHALTVAERELHMAKQSLNQAKSMYNSLTSSVQNLQRISTPAYKSHGLVTVTAAFLTSATDKFPPLIQRLSEREQAIALLQRQAEDLTTPDLTEGMLNEVLQDLADQDALRKHAKQEAQKLREPKRFFSLFRSKKK